MLGVKAVASGWVLGQVFALRLGGGAPVVASLVFLAAVLTLCAALALYTNLRLA